MGDPDENPVPSTADSEYTDRLRRLGGNRWKQVLDVQAPYRWNVRRLGLGRTLDIGCGLGRNLMHLDGHGVGVDHNPDSVAVARAHGLEAYTVDEFLHSDRAVPASFDSLLAAHVVEHMSEQDAVAMLRGYLVYLKPQGKLCLITPQEVGYRSDATHVRFVDFEALTRLSRALDLEVVRQFSFPFPRVVGKAFRYNEFVQLSALHAAKLRG
jgi:2-polyprenyl-3-methyl-5-hydroxy-6-metoxy-1,4-benzoquinol methylase